MELLSDAITHGLKMGEVSYDAVSLLFELLDIIRHPLKDDVN